MSSTLGKVTPHFNVVSEGESAEMKCLSYGWVEWLYEEKILQTNSKIIIFINTLTIKNVSHSDMGMYFCYGIYANKNMFIAQSSLFVKSKCFHFCVYLITRNTLRGEILTRETPDQI